LGVQHIQCSTEVFFFFLIASLLRNGRNPRRPHNDVADVDSSEESKFKKSAVQVNCISNDKVEKMAKHCYMKLGIQPISIIFPGGKN
jgi:hypothetical protein